MTIGGTDIVPPMLIRGPDVGSRMVIQWADVGWPMRIHPPDVGCRMAIRSAYSGRPILIHQEKPPVMPKFKLRLCSS